MAIITLNFREVYGSRGKAQKDAPERIHHRRLCRRRGKGLHPGPLAPKSGFGGGYLFACRETRVLYNEILSGFEDRGFVYPQPARQAEREHLPLTLSSRRSSMVNLDRGWQEWLVDGRLPRIGTSILVGERGAGKSTLARELAMRVARGRPWLDFQTVRGAALYVYLEGDRDNVRAAFAGLGLSPSDNLHFVDDVSMSELRQRIRERAKSLQPALIVVDGLGQLLRAEQLNDPAERSTALDRILDLAVETRSHLLLVHDLEGPVASGMSALLGSTERTVDTIFMLNRVGEQRLLRSMQRQGRAVLTPIHVPSHAAAVVPTPVSRRPADEHPELRREILSYLRLSSRLATQKEIAEFVEETNAAAIFRALNSMCSQEKLIRVGGGEPGDPHRYTGCDVAEAPARAPWLRRVRPWARVSPMPLTTPSHRL